MKHPKTILCLAETLWLIILTLAVYLLVSCKTQQTATTATSSLATTNQLHHLLQTLKLQDTTTIYFLNYPATATPQDKIFPATATPQAKLFQQQPDNMHTPSAPTPAIMKVRSLDLRSIERDTTQQTKAETTQATSQTETEREATTTTSHTTTIITIVLILALLVFLWLQRRRLIHRGYI